jgi:hypothetical protein
MVNSNIIEGGVYEVLTTGLVAISDTSINVVSRDFKLINQTSFLVFNTLPPSTGLTHSYDNCEFVSGPGSIMFIGLNGCHLTKCTVFGDYYSTTSSGVQPFSIPFGDTTFVDCDMYLGQNSILSLGPPSVGNGVALNVSVLSKDGQVNLSNIEATNCTFNSSIVNITNNSKMINGTVNSNNTTSSPVVLSNATNTIQGVEINVDTTTFAAINATTAGGVVVNCTASGTNTIADFGTFSNGWTATIDAAGNSAQV